MHFPLPTSQPGADAMMALLTGVVLRRSDEGLLVATGADGGAQGTPGVPLIWPAGCTAQVSDADGSVHVYDPDGRLILSTDDGFVAGGGTLWWQDPIYFPAGREVFVMDVSPTRVEPSPQP